MLIQRNCCYEWHILFLLRWCLHNDNTVPCYKFSKGDHTIFFSVFHCFNKITQTEYFKKEGHLFISILEA